MSLSVTRSSVFLGQGLVGGDGIEFIPTDMDAVDASGKPTGGKLLIAKTPLIKDHRHRINARLFEQGLTHGSMALHRDGTAYVIERSDQQQSQKMDCQPTMEKGHGFETVLSPKRRVQFVPDTSSWVLIDPYFRTHPAVDMTWYESASLAAALEDAVQERFPGMRIRMMRMAETRRFLKWDDKYTEEQVQLRAHLARDKSVKAVLSTVGNVATGRTTDEGFVDVFGNVRTWLDSAHNPPPDPDPRYNSNTNRFSRDYASLLTGVNIDRIGRIAIGASWKMSPWHNARVGSSYPRPPRSSNDTLGVRFVAVPAAPRLSGEHWQDRSK